MDHYCFIIFSDLLMAHLCISAQTRMWLMCFLVFCSLISTPPCACLGGVLFSPALFSLLLGLFAKADVALGLCLLIPSVLIYHLCPLSGQLCSSCPVDLHNFPPIHHLGISLAWSSIWHESYHGSGVGRIRCAGVYGWRTPVKMSCFV